MPAHAAAPIRYRRVQFGTMIAVGTALGVALSTWMLVAVVSSATLAAVPWLGYALYGVRALAFLLFGQLAVTVDEHRIRAVFGVGLVRKVVEVRDVRSAAIVRTRLWWGYGVHWTPAGWLYNVGGRWALRLDLAAERPVMIGTRDPEGLRAAIEAALAARDGTAGAGPAADGRETSGAKRQPCPTDVVR